MKYTNTIILMVISFILGFMVSRIMSKNMEPLVNLDDSRKIELSKCCTDDKCYSKPPHLRTDCVKNKEEAFKKLEEKDLIKNKSNFQRDVDYMNKFNAKIAVMTGSDKLADALFTKIRMDDRGEVKGYDNKLF